MKKVLIGILAVLGLFTILAMLGIGLLGFLSMAMIMVFPQIGLWLPNLMQR